jgi:uncharacterized membrane protein YqgA involved in biofilm formation
LEFDHYESIVGAVLISIIALVTGVLCKKQINISKQLNFDVEKQAKKSKTKQSLKETKKMQF